MKKKKRLPLEKRKSVADALDENKLRENIIRVLGKYDVRNEKQFILFGKWLVFIFLVVVEILIISRYLDGFNVNGGWDSFRWLLIFSVALTVSQALKLFVIKQNKHRIAFYVLDALLACCFVFFATGAFAMAIYIVVLTQLYLNFESMRPSMTLFIISTLLYAAFDIVQAVLLVDGPVYWVPVLMTTIESVFVLVVQFIIVQVALAFYRQFLRLDKALRQLDASNKELEKAYEAVVEMTALEERQRIAKEIHDSAGHSLTTVIMQTEAAKLIIDSDPEEAKSKIVAANLQAKHALESLRDSVHLLSGASGNETLRSALTSILQESMDGTGIVIRSEIEDVTVSTAKFRFLCNTLKEGISNGIRHGGATAFWFELKTENGQICFLLSDNGKGVEKKRLQMGFGLTTLIERAQAFGGDVEIETDEGDGFELKMKIPCDRQDEKEE